MASVLGAYGRAAAGRVGRGAVGGGFASPGALGAAAPVSSGGPMALTPPPTLGSFSPDALLKNYNQAYGDAKNANQTMYNNVLGGYGDLESKVGGQYNTLSNNVLDSYKQNGQGLLAGYNQRYNDAMSNLAGAGAQETADINQSAQAQGANIQQGLVNSGLAGTTVAPTLAIGNEKNKQAELGRLNESLRQQRLSTMAGLSGDTLAAQANLNQGQAGLASQLGQAQIGAQSGIGQNKLNFQERVNQPYPDLNQLSQTMIGLGKAGYGSGGAGPGGAGAGLAGPGGSGLGGYGAAGASNGPRFGYNAPGSWAKGQAGPSKPIFTRPAPNPNGPGGAMAYAQWAAENGDRFNGGY